MSEKAIWLDIAQVCGCIIASSRQVKIQYKDAYIIDIWKLSTCVVDRVEIKHYSVAYFDRITAFEHSTSVTGGAHIRCVNLKYLTCLHSVYESHP